MDGLNKQKLVKEPENMFRNEKDIGTGEFFFLLLFCLVIKEGYDYISKVKLQKLDELDTFQENNKLQTFLPL